jgi:hypothetical protein
MARSVGFKQADVTRAVKGLKAAGETVTRVEIDRSGKIVAILRGAGQDEGGENEWDEVFDNAKGKRPAAERH